MPKHEEFAELCALAMVGEASADELKNLRTHLRECEDCRREYREFTQLVLPQLQAMDDGASAMNDDASAPDTARLRASFLSRAQEQGIQFSAKTLAGAQGSEMADSGAVARSVAVFPSRPIWYATAGIAAGLVFGAVLMSQLAHRPPVESSAVPARQSPAPDLADRKADTDSGPGASVTTMQATDPASAEVVRLEARESELQKALGDLREQLAGAEADRASLRQQLADKTNALAQAQTDTGMSQQTVSELRGDVIALQARADLNAATYRDAQAKVQGLSAELAEAQASLQREHDMLDAGREMRDMMAARNLHIVDVFDTDSKGKTDSAFGRIFFAENRKLVFYAYDLNPSGPKDVRYDYRIWGQKEGQPRTAQSLGIFYSDSKTERRWVFQCDDPKVLSEIDSVFVTLEPTTTDPKHPRGPQLMYAYLRGQPNHP